jgi:hypothetical protein
MPGFVPGIYVFLRNRAVVTAWMPGTSPGTTEFFVRLAPYAYFCATNLPTKIDSQRLPVT